MKHSLNELLDLAYQYYSRDIGDSPVKETAEHARLVAARQKAVTDKRWPAMLHRISERFPGMLTNQSLHLPTGSLDACYSFTISSPEAHNHQSLWFSISFLAPYYISYSSRLIDTATQIEGFSVTVHGMQFYIPQHALGPKFMSNLGSETPKSATIKREEISFDLSTDEQLHAAWITQDIEAAFGCERMSAEIGTVLVPDVKTNLRILGEARLFDCLFTDSHPWVKSLQSKEATRLEVEASQMPGPFITVLTVLAAFYSMGLALAPPQIQNAYFRASSDGVLRKDELLQALAKMRVLHESPKTLHAISAAREFEGLLAVWNGEDGPSDALIAWAKSFLTGIGQLHS